LGLALPWIRVVEAWTRRDYAGCRGCEFVSWSLIVNISRHAPSCVMLRTSEKGLMPKTVVATDAKARLKRKEEFWIEASQLVFQWAIGAGFLGAFAEGYRWLRSGIWAPYDTWPIGRMFIDNSWLTTPGSWLGAHRVTVWCLELPLFITLPVIAIAILAGGCWTVAANYEDSANKL